MNTRSAVDRILLTVHGRRTMQFGQYDTDDLAHAVTAHEVGVVRRLLHRAGRQDVVRVDPGSARAGHRRIGIGEIWLMRAK